MFETPESRREDDATEAAFADPQVGDSFHEMFIFRMFVIAVEHEGRVAVMTTTPPCTLPDDGKVEIFGSHDAYRAHFAYGTIPGYWIRLGERGVNVTGWFKDWPAPAAVDADEDGTRSPHPEAFRLLYDAFRKLDCTTALDPADQDDCASVADEAVRVLMSAGLLTTTPGTEHPGGTA